MDIPWQTPHRFNHAFLTLVRSLSETGYFADKIQSLQVRETIWILD
jgi:hypothetical protein